MELLPLGKGHLEGVTALEREVFREQDPWPESAFEAEMQNPDGIWMVADREGQVAGYGGGWCVEPEFHLLNLAVAPSVRRQGIAIAILARVFDGARERGCCEVILEVRRGNAGAEALYAKLGFSPVSRRPRYYAGGEDALVMRMELPAAGEAGT